MKYIKRILLIGCTILSDIHGYGQEGNLNRISHDMNAFYFGISVGYNSSTLLTTRNEAFLQQASINRIEPHSSQGIEMGFSATARLSNRLDLRFAPKLVLGGQKYLSYYFTDAYLQANPGKEAVENIKLPTNILSFPLDLKLKSDRIHNFRVYMFGGMRYDKNLSANSAEYRQAKQLGENPPPQFRSGDFAYEGGLGFNFYMPFSVISPEIKFSRTLGNSHIRDADNPYSAPLDIMRTQSIVFTINIEQ
ncbi:MAG: outer membrane beta-barrel protein [Arachidicoccus sp.]|nr:outer membrane beta-barrel protein [Arachidicoccus sp.]